MEEIVVVGLISGEDELFGEEWVKLFYSEKMMDSVVGVYDLFSG